MSRYIDADAIKYTDGKYISIAFKDDIDKMPTADVVEVVRCKDCIHYSADGWGYGNCYRSSVDYLRMADNGYCSYGERKEDE